MNRIYGRLTRSIKKSWQMYPLGILFGVGFDTFYDRRSGFMFYTNPLGALAVHGAADRGKQFHHLARPLR